MTVDRQSFIFYHSFYDAINDLPDSEQLALYKAIAQYSFTLKEPKLQGMSSTIFKLIKPQIEANNRRYVNGKKGAKRKQSESKTKANGKQTESKTKANVNVNVNENVNDKDNVNDNENENNNINNKKSKKYKFKGEVIKLSEKHYDDWKKAYRYIDLDRELKRLDDFYCGEGVTDWFFRASNALSSANKEQKPHETGNPDITLMSEKELMNYYETGKYEKLS